MRKKTMGTIFTKWRTALLAISFLAVFALVACGEDDAVQAVAQAPTSVPPTATQAVIEVTVAPVPIETPVPTPTIEPTPEPTEVPSKNGEDFLAETKSQPEIEFPAAISKGAEKLEPEAALAEWHELLTGTRQIAINESIILEFCSGGIGTWVWEIGSPGFTGQKFDWELVSDPGGSWRSTVVIIKMHEQNLYDLLNYAGGDGWRLGLNQPDQYSNWQIFESPECV